uniref:Uncharacterized protein n=1 Tax=Panagrolaimus sp. ES5 TaxID=591445 RepID=A0AC34F076_9BILA
MEDIIAEIGSLITINALTGALFAMEKEETYYEKGQNVKLLEECFTKIKKLNKTVCIDSDEDEIHSWLSFDCALEIFKDLHHIIDSYYPEQWNNFCMIENETLRDNFLEIAKILYPVIEQITDESLLACLNILPENIIPSKKIVSPNDENADQKWKEKASECLKNNLKRVRKAGCTLCQYDYSLFSSGCVHEFDDKRNSRYAYSQQSEDVYQILVKRNLQDLIQSASYYFYVISSADAEKKVTIRLTVGEDGVTQIPPSLYAEGEKKMNISFTVDSDGNILIGNFIWMRPSVNKNLIPEIFMVAAFYEEAIAEYDNNLMKSVQCFKNQKNAILLAQRMNKMLTKIDDETLCKKLIRIFPETLYEKWSGDPDYIFQIMMNAFTELEKRSISWSMNFNGHFLISEYMTLTAKHLSKIKNFNEFEKLLTGLREPVHNYLTCKEEIMYARNKEKRVIRTKTDASKIFNVREKYSDIRVDPNLALVIESVLIIHPEDFLRHTEEGVTDILNIINIIKLAFNSTEDILFQFGHVDFPILTSIFYNADEQEIQYADNLKAFLQDTVNVKIEEKTKMFMINDSLRIHPKSFFHLQNARNVMAVVKQFDPKHLLLYQETVVKKDLETKIKKQKNINLEEHCLSKIGEILLRYKDNIKADAIRKHLNEQEDDLKSLCVNGHFLFKEPFSYKMFNKNGEVKLSKEIIIIALNIASDLDENCKCKDMIDFTLLAFTINEYGKKGRQERENELIKTSESKIPYSLMLTSSEHYNKLMEFLMGQIKKIKICNKNQQFSFIELENWLNKCEKYDSLEKCLTEQRQQMEKDFLMRLEQIVSKERLEFEQPRKICLTMIGKLFWKNITKINFPGIEHIYLNEDEKEMHGIENLRIKSVKIFKEGIAYIWLKDGTKLRFNDNLFILAMKYSASLKENLKCQNTFDFNSVLEIRNSAGWFIKFLNSITQPE